LIFDNSINYLNLFDDFCQLIFIVILFDEKAIST